MGVGPTEGVTSAPPPPSPTAPANQSGPAATPANNPSPAKTSPGNLANLPAKIDKDLEDYRKGRSEPSESNWDAWDRLRNDVSHAIKGALPRHFDSHFEERLQEVGRRLIAKHGGDRYLAGVVNRVVYEVINNLPDTQRAAVTTQRILSNPTRDNLLALAEEYQLTAITDDIKHPNGDEFKAAMRNDPGYKKIIKIEAERCFAGKNIRTVVSNILQVVNSSDIAPAVKQDFLNSVLNYAKSRNVVLPGDNAEYFRGLADGFLELKGNP